MTAKTDNMITDAELAELPTDVQTRYREAETSARDAVTLFDFGVARGCLLGMKRDGRIDASTLDRMFKRTWSVVPPQVLDTIPEEHSANLGRGIVVPAAPGTRRSRVD